MAKVQDKSLIPKEIPLNKKLVTALDPALVGDNFQSLKNMRPTPGHIKAIDGMTKINTSILAGGNTLITNGDMELDANWTDVNTPPINEQSSTQKHSGSYSRKFTADALYDGIQSDVFTTVTGAVYSVNFWVYPTKDNSAGTFAVGVTQGSDSGWAYLDEMALVQNQWNEVTFGYTETSGGASARIKFMDYLCVGADGGWYVDDVVLKVAYLKWNGFHFEKKQPAESHVLVQAYNTGLTASQVLQNTTAIPSQGDFSATALHTDASGAGRGRFSNAPRGCVGYCNGEESMIWSGDEGEISSFIISTAAITNIITNPMEYTEQVRNNISSIEESATIGGGNDSNTKLMIHCDGAAGDDITDVSTSAHGNATKVDHADISNGWAKFGTGSIFFDGLTDLISFPDHADWRRNTGKFTMEGWFRIHTLPVEGRSEHLLGVYQDVQNKAHLYCVMGVGGYTLRFYIRDGSVDQVNFTAEFYDAAINTDYHFAVIRGWGGNADDFAITVNGIALATTTAVGATWDADDDWTGAFYIGGRILEDTSFHGYVDEVRFSDVARWTANFTPPTRAYRSAGIYWLVGNDKPLKGVKYYIKNANNVSGTMTCKEWNGTGWDALTIADNTATDGVPLAKTGTVTWSSTEDTSKMKYLQGMLLYWYQFYVGAATANADIYYTTVDAPFQKLRDLWDGIDRELISFQWWDNSGNVYNDLTLNVFGNEYISTNSGTYADLNALEATDDALYIGFAERTTAISFNIVSGKQNTTAATTATVYYWDGSAWTSVGTIVDGTSENSISLAKTGVISWSAPNREEEFRTEIGNSPSLYYYKIVFNATFPANLPWLYYISGIPAQKKIQGYNFPFMSHDRIWLCGQKADKKNSAICSATGSTVHFNGEDSMEFRFGDDSDLTAAANLFSQFGSSLYNINIFCKANESWVLSGNGPEDWVKYRLSENVGCPAPLTMAVVDLPIEVAQGGNRSLAIWQGANGIYMSDGRAPIPIHGSIENYFDKSKSECIRASKIGDSDGWIDHEKLEYHWLFASGTTATTLNKEWVFSIREQKWFEIDRGTGKRLQCAFGVKDTDGNTYTYGCIDTGYMERLENGNDFDGGDIDCEFQFGDMALHEGKISYETRLRNIRLIATAQNLNGGSVTCTHYGDSKAAGTATTMVQTNSGYRLVNTPKSDSLGPHVFHSLKFQLTRASGDIRFEPLFVIAMYKISGLDKQA